MASLEEVRKEITVLTNQFDILDAVVRDAVNQAKKVNQMLKEALENG